MSIAIPDEFIDHGKVDELQNDIGLEYTSNKVKNNSCFSKLKATIKFN